LRLRERELASVLAEYKSLPESERKGTLDDPALAKPPKRPVPQPPAGGLIIRGYCTYLQRGKDNRIDRAVRYYYRENPDRWIAETQSDLLWLTEAEKKSLVPEAKVGAKVDVNPPIQKRFYSTIGIDYMEGSVNSLPLREGTMTLTVERADDAEIVMRLDGYAKLGKRLDEKTRKEENSRGSELRIRGEVRYDRRKQTCTAFDVAGVGKAWGNKMDYVHREIRLDDHPWMYGIAWELVTGDRPHDRIPPYNLLHYNSTKPYFAEGN
jgi:hypothetical protein